MMKRNELKVLEDELVAAPTNLEIAWKYWRALGQAEGHDVRCGAHVLKTFRSAALEGPRGAVALAQAWRELFNLSGEEPKQMDAELHQALHEAMPFLKRQECAEVQWVLARARLEQ